MLEHVVGEIGQIVGEKKRSLIGEHMEREGEPKRLEERMEISGEEVDAEGERAREGRKGSEIPGEGDCWMMGFWIH